MLLWIWVCELAIADFLLLAIRCCLMTSLKMMTSYNRMFACLFADFLFAYSTVLR